MRFDEQQFHEHVRRLFIKPDDVQGRALHAAVGIAGESGEILDAMKKTWIYEKPLDLVNIIEECGDCLFYIAALLDQYGFTLGYAAANYEKLARRYPYGYTDQAAIARADKE